jgi:tetraacyldisaccharide 4'-kinase
VILLAASKLYGTAATWRRRWYAHNPSRRRRLDRPVISVGNLNTGGSGKTPIVAYIAGLLAARGERPAILSRGYGRTSPESGATVVSDGTTVFAPLERAGDEPLMLARALSNVPVVVSANRYVAGCVAERTLGATVHVLDDGFQHLGLERDVDLLVACSRDLSDQVLPAGRLREPLTAAASADALLVEGSSPAGIDEFKRALGVGTAFHAERRLGGPRWLHSGAPATVGAGDVIVAVAGIARPDRFFADLEAAHLVPRAKLVFRDHHPYTDADIERIARAARDTGATLVLTTEKDAVRLSARRLGDLPFATVPLTVAVEPSFSTWLLDKIKRTRHPAPSTEHPAPSTEHPAPSTEHPALGTQHPAPDTHHS